MAKYGKFQTKTQKKRRSWGFAIFMVLYAVVVLAAAAWGLGKFWDYMEAYEGSRIKNTIDAYMEQVSPKYVCDRSGDLIGSIDHNLQSEEACRQVILDFLSGGITYARSKQPHLRQLAPEEGMESLSDDKSICANCLVRTGIPLGFDERENGVYFLHPEAARQMTRQELKQLLAKNVVTDGETVEYLKTQGIDLGVEMLACNEAQKLTALERYSNHPVNAVGRDHFPASFFAGGRTNYRMLTKLPEGSEVLGWYQFGD